MYNGPIKSCLNFVVFVCNAEACGASKYKFLVVLECHLTLTKDICHLRLIYLCCLLVILYVLLYVAFLWDELVFHMPVVLDLMWQVSFCHEGTDLWENVLSYLFVLGT